MGKQPQIVEIKMAAVEAMVERAKGLQAKEDHDLLKGLVDTLLTLVGLVRKGRTTIARLRRLVGMVSTEKTTEVLGKLSEGEASAADGTADPAEHNEEKPAAENNAAAGKQSSTTETAASPKPDTGAQAATKPKGHGRLPASDYPDATHITVAHESLSPGDICPAYVVTFQDPTPYFDTSYSVNSVNVGPYGDAILEELIPEIVSRFRVIDEPYARILTGGWEALAMQIFYPDFFGGTFAYAPDPVTFTNVEGINIYEDVNAFYKQHEWRRVPIANTRETNGEIRMTSKQRNTFELVAGTKGRSGQQLDIWSAVFGPLGDDGYFKPLFDKRTGAIDPEVAQYWRENYDLLHHLKNNWASLGPKLFGKVHVYCGDMDNYYLNVAVKELQEWMRQTENPHYPGVFVWGDGAGHRFGREFSTEAERIRRMAEHVLSMRPDGAPHPWWQF